MSLASGASRVGRRMIGRRRDIKIPRWPKASELYRLRGSEMMDYRTRPGLPKELSACSTSSMR
jgi:hypothetical protein